MSVVTIKPITLAGIPQPRFRFDDTDSSVVMTNRPIAFGASGVMVAAVVVAAGRAQTDGFAQFTGNDFRFNNIFIQ